MFKCLLQWFRIAVVTGGNKGLGLEICKQLAKDVMVVLTARDEKRGADVVAELHSCGLSDVVFHQLDVTFPASIASLANFVDTRFGKLNILVNNAGVITNNIDEEFFSNFNLLTEAYKKAYEKGTQYSKKVVPQTYEGARKCLETNYYGAKHVTQALLPLLLKSTFPKIVNISSKLAQLQYVQDEGAKKILSDVDGLTEEVVDGVMSEYLKDAKDQESMEKKGWSNIVSSYVISKAALNAYTRILAKKYPFLSANAITPGYLATDFTSSKGIFTVEEGARGPVRLALIPGGGPSGQYFFQMEKSTF
ncbi:salutaridine reductase [Lactuca sativa]|uniref:salutaridine reductase n=1 Tax=Lactuca sativa TaxID=4236 RepID=UPI001C68D734|nr:salutaridine reductase [Lactuca sativa]